MTISILIGNSDDKLKQTEWSEYCNSVAKIVAFTCSTIYFTASSEGSARWQNACFVAEIQPSEIDWIRSQLTAVRKKYEQDSVAIIIGKTEFI